jgi:hypothetical protein
MFFLTKTAGTTSHNFSFLFGGTATVNNILTVVESDLENSAYSSGTILSGDPAFFAATGLTTFTLNSAITSANHAEYLFVKGTVSVNAGGTFIPQYSLSAAPGGAYSVRAGSFFSVYPLAASGADVNVGTWA